MSEIENNADLKTQHLTFSLAGEEYGVDILVVREIRGWSKVTPLPQMPNYLLGVLNLRGAVVPIIDLRCRFGIPRTDSCESSVTIVIDVAGHFTGIVVDAVSDVRDIACSEIKPMPEINGSVDTRYLKGLCTFEDRMLQLLDVDKLLGPHLDALGVAELAAVPLAA